MRGFAAGRSRECSRERRIYGGGWNPIRSARPEVSPGARGQL